MLFKPESWENYWAQKKEKNQLLINAIKDNDLAGVIKLLDVTKADQKDVIPDVNHTFYCNNMLFTPLLFAIYCCKKDTRSKNLVEALLSYGANPNFQELKTGMNALMMCCHVETETEAFGIA